MTEPNELLRAVHHEDLVDEIAAVMRSLEDRAVKAEAQLAEMQWVSVKERLPERDRPVLVRFRPTAETYSVRGLRGNGWYEGGITHWMPIPDPPSGRGGWKPEEVSDGN